jgi:purine-binding chemotaxis protein CheW
MENQKLEMTDLLQLVSFKVGSEEFGVDILKVQEINKMLKITRVPNAPEFVEGVVNLRGRIIPVIDLRKRLSLSAKEHDSKTRIVVVDIGGNIVGFIVDEVNEVLRVSKDIIENPPELVSKVESDFITSVAKLDDRIIILLDLDNLLEKDEQQKLDSISE